MISATAANDSLHGMRGEALLGLTWVGNVAHTSGSEEKSGADIAEGGKTCIWTIVARS